jgi:hypothetical protein
LHDRDAEQISGHVLRNQGVLDPADPENVHLPDAVSGRLITIRSAALFDQKKFLSSTIVYDFLHDEWVGGGWRGFTNKEKAFTICMQIAFSGPILLYNLLLLVLFAIYPPLHSWYMDRFEFETSQTPVRLVFALFNVPAFKWALNQAIDFVFLIVFTHMQVFIMWHQDAALSYDRHSASIHPG